MTLSVSIIVLLVFGLLSFWAWRRYLWAARSEPPELSDRCEFSLTDRFGDNHLVNVPHQDGIEWLSDVFSRSAQRFPGHTALQVPHTGESLTFSELDARVDSIAEALSRRLTGPDQVVAVAMSQDNWQIVACHLAILRAGGVLMFLDTSLPEALITHMLADAQPVVVLTRGEEAFRDLPTLDVLTLPATAPGPRVRPHWMDDPAQRLATIFYTSGTTGLPKGVENAHAGYVNLALSYADYFDLTAGMDAVSLTSSLGYDGSISEMYSAWVSGCAVVLLTKEQIRSGPDLVPVLRDAEVTVLFCPPVLLTTLTSSPERDLPYPICRYIVPAGEAFPSALVEPWTRARRQIINTYGPTEASTDTSRQSLRPGEPVTIGSPMPNVTYVILEEDGLQPLPHGDVGELCIGGVHVARGYRNLPEQTARKFIEHARFGRLYRTGDRCRIDARSHQVEFLGRTDTQLKVRGHRVEIQGVEDILQTQFQDIEAAVLDYQNEELVAFIVAPSLLEPDSAEVVPAPEPWAADTLAHLAARLPEPSVPSRLFLVDKFVLKPTSGKIDRGLLPKLSELKTASGSVASTGRSEVSASSEGAHSGDIVRSEDDARLEAGDREVLGICRDVLETPLGLDDVFSDHGGHSIAIARLAQRLHAAGWRITVRALLTDCNTPRKVASQARHSDHAVPAAGHAPAPARPVASGDEAATVLSVAGFTTLQALFLLLLYLPTLTVFVLGAANLEVGEFFVNSSLIEFIAAGLAMYVLALFQPFFNLLWVMTIKRIANGSAYRNNIAPGIYPKWSSVHLKYWCAWRMERFVLRPLNALYRSPPLMAFGLRHLGARIGRNFQCEQGVDLAGPLDLLTVEDDVTVQTGAYLHVSRWVGQDLHIGPIRLERDCRIGMRAGVANDVTVGGGAWIGSFTPVLGNVGAHELWEGAPAQFSGRCTRLTRTANHCRYVQPVWWLETQNILMQCVLEFLLMIVPLACVGWLAEGIFPIADSGLGGDYFRAAPFHEIAWYLALFAIVTSWSTAVLSSLLICLFLRFTAMPPGLYPTRGLAAALLLYRMKKMNQIQAMWTWSVTGQYLRALAGMRFTRLGASECDVMFNLVPETASADANIFWSNGSFTNMLDYGAEHVRLRQLDMPLNFFSGNNSVAEAGHFPSNFLLGVSTAVGDIQYRRQMRTRAGEPLTIVGNPPIQIPERPADPDAAGGILPTYPLFVTRLLLNDILKIGALPGAGGALYVFFFCILLQLQWPPLFGALVSLMMTELVLVAASAAVKQLMVGRDWGRDHSTPFWSLRHFTYFFAQDCFFAWCRFPLSVWSGTVLSNTLLRSMGCRIGKRTIIPDPMQASDWNAVKFGDDCIVAGFLQLHTFEDMVLKARRTDIGSGSSVSFGATVMGGAVIEPDTTVLPMAMILKQMHLPAGTYQGSPAEFAPTDTAGHLPVGPASEAERDDS